MSLQVRGQGLMSVPPTPASCDFGSASCTHSGLVFIDQGSVSLTFEEHCLGPLVCVLQHEAGGCVCVCTCVCVCVCAHTYTNLSWPPPRSPPCLSPEQRAACGRERLGPSARRPPAGLEPSPSRCFPSPPLGRPSSLFLFLFCCRFNSSSLDLFCAS